MSQATFSVTVHLLPLDKMAHQGGLLQDVSSLAEALAVLGSGPVPKECKKTMRGGARAELQ